MSPAEAGYPWQNRTASATGRSTPASRAAVAAAGLSTVRADTDSPALRADATVDRSQVRQCISTAAQTRDRARRITRTGVRVDVQRQRGVGTGRTTVRVPS